MIISHHLWLIYSNWYTESSFNGEIVTSFNLTATKWQIVTLFFGNFTCMDFSSTCISIVSKINCYSLLWSYTTLIFYAVRVIVEWAEKKPDKDLQYHFKHKISISIKLWINRQVPMSTTHAFFPLWLQCIVCFLLIGSICMFQLSDLMLNKAEVYTCRFR
jgi:hypothetical protein